MFEICPSTCKHADSCISILGLAPCTQQQRVYMCIQGHMHVYMFVVPCARVCPRMCNVSVCGLSQHVGVGSRQWETLNFSLELTLCGLWVSFFRGSKSESPSRWTGSGVHTALPRQRQILSLSMTTL